MIPSGSGQRGVSNHVASGHRKVHWQRINVWKLKQKLAATGIQRSFRNTHICGVRKARRQDVCLSPSRDESCEIIICVQDDTTVLTNSFRQCAFFQRNGFARFHEFNVSSPNIRNDRSIRSRNCRQWRNLTRMVHSHFKHANLIFWICRQHC